mgnify:CR=1 FL=1
MNSPELPDHVSREIARALSDGRKIEAVKIYRDATGASLKDSKDYIDSFHLTKEPSRSSCGASRRNSEFNRTAETHPGTQSTGCALMILLFAAILIGGVILSC